MWWWRSEPGAPPGFERGSAEGVRFVSDDSCRSCHSEQWQDWTGSHHDLAMQIATPETVLGDFNGAQFDHRGVSWRFSRKGDEFLVEIEEPGGAKRTVPVRYTYGVTPLQQYLVPAEGGRLQTLTVAWDTANKRWFTLYPEERVAPEDPLHWSGRYQTWNTMCAPCHSTNVRRNYDAKADAFSTQWDAIDVGCQACHGPGERHVEWAQSGRKGGLVVDYSAGDSTLEADSCAPCHSRRVQLTESAGIGGKFLDHYSVQLLDEGLYYPDGQMLDEVYVYGSFLQSKMYHRGVRCSDCHDSHSLRLKRAGNATCTHCHSQNPPARFPTLKSKIYDSAAHHHHTGEGKGTACVDCHMASRSYMILDPRRDHSFRIPRPDLTQKIGVPNACNGCHESEGAGWAADKVAQWYGTDRRDAKHFGEALAAGRARRPDAPRELFALASDAEQPAIVRATALDLLRYQAPPDILGEAASLVRDPEPLVRMRTATLLENLPGAARAGALAPLLTDSVRAVRIEAARSLASAANDLPQSARASFEQTIGEYREAQSINSDVPAAHLNLGSLAGAGGDPAGAEAEYRAALRLDPFFAPASLNLATLLNEAGKNAEAREVLERGIERTPQNGDLHYSLGLLYAEENNYEAAAQHLGKAADLLPNHPRARYNYGLALQHLGRRGAAEEQLRLAYEANSEDLDSANALLVFYLQQQDSIRALPYAEKLLAATPGNAELQTLVARLRAELR